MRQLILFSACLVSLSTQAQSLLWQISGNGLAKPSYLFGTYHILRDSYLKGDSLTRIHFEQAEGVIVEMVFDSTERSKVMQHSTMTNNNLIHLIDANDYKLVADEFNAVMGQELSFYNQMKPIIIATALSVAYARQQSDMLTKFSGLPIDLYFVKQAQAAQKPLMGLETLDEQLTILYDRQPVEQQAKHLVRMVKQKNVPRQPGTSLTDMYLRADLEGMWNLFQHESDNPADLYDLIDERNLHWMSRLRATMAERPTFIAVGVGHLPGQNGLLNLLREAGYVVQAVK